MLQLPSQLVACSYTEEINYKHAIIYNYGCVQQWMHRQWNLQTICTYRQNDYLEDVSNSLWKMNKNIK